MARLSIMAILLAYSLTGAIMPEAAPVPTDQIQLQTVLPKLQAIHEDSRSLLIKNGELKAKILIGLQAQNEAKLKMAKESQLATGQQQPQARPNQPGANKDAIDYAELEEFNKWVDVNLDYAVKNTRATIETLKEEAQLNNGMIDYSEQAIKDGIEGVKYWQSAVIFQDKTLNNEKFEVTD